MEHDFRPYFPKMYSAQHILSQEVVISVLFWWLATTMQRVLLFRSDAGAMGET